MRSGERIASEVENRIVELRRDYPGWTQQQIADAIRRQFGVQVDRSSVSNVLRRRGVRGPRAAGAVSHGATADVVTARAALRHTREVSRAATALIEAVEPLPPHIMMSDHPDGVAPNPEARRLAHIERDYYYASLRGHIPGERVWSICERFKGEHADYVRACQDLVERLAAHLESAAGIPLRRPREWSAEGLYFAAALHAYRRSTWVAFGANARGLEGREYQIEHQGPRQGELHPVWVLWYAGDGLAIHRSREVLDEWRGLHQQIIADDQFHQEAFSLVAAYRRLEKMSEPMRSLLRVEIERGTFGAGRCSLCP